MDMENNTEEKEYIKIIDENGEEKEVEVLHYFTLESNNLDYIVYTDNKEDKDGNILIYTSEVVELEDKVELKGIDDQAVLKEITDILTDLIKD